jgi:hypothetical protein
MVKMMIERMLLSQMQGNISILTQCLISLVMKNFKNKASCNIAWIDFKGKKVRWDLTAEMEVTGLNEYCISI